MDSSTQKSAADAKSMNDLFELVEKLTIQMNEKDKELQENRQTNEELLANIDLERARANRVDALETELAIAQQDKLTLQMAIWKSLSSADLFYYIKVPSGPGGEYDGYLYQNISTNYLCSGTAFYTRFKLTKNSDGTFSIYSVSTEKYLQAETNSYQSATAYFTFANNISNPSKFVLNYNHQQNKHPGILVDIYSLANGFFLSVGNQQDQNRVVANLRTAPAKKFLLVPVE